MEMETEGKAASEAMRRGRKQQGKDQRKKENQGAAQRDKGCRKERQTEEDMSDRALSLEPRPGSKHGAVGPDH